MDWIGNLISLMLYGVGYDQLQKDQKQAVDFNTQRFEEAQAATQGQSENIDRLSGQFAGDSARMRDLRSQAHGVGNTEIRNARLLRDDIGVMGDRFETDSAARRAGLLGESDRRFDALDTGLQGEYGDLRTRALGYLEGQGDQTRADINTNFDESKSSALAALTRSGFRGGTAASNVETGNTRERSAELRRLDESLARQLLEADVETTTAGLTARERIRLAQADNYRSIGMDNAAAADRIGAGNVDLHRLLGQGVNEAFTGAGNRNLQYSGMEAALPAAHRSEYNDLYNNWVRNVLGLSEASQQPIPQTNQLLETGRGFYALRHQPEAPKSDSGWLGPTIGAAGTAGAGLLGGLAAGGGAASAGLAASIFVMVCIDGESVLTSEDGPKKLKDVRVGDSILNTARQLRRVVAKHFGPYSGDGRDYVKLRFGKKSIVASLNHIIEGELVSDWITKGLEFERVVPESSGDILLDDASDYLANGLAVRSLIEPSDVAVLAQLEPENQVPIGV